MTTNDVHMTKALRTEIKSVRSAFIILLVQSETSQGGNSAATVGDVDGVDAVGNHTVACEGLPDIAFAYGNHCDGILVRIGSDLKAAVHISDKGKIDLGYIPAVEVFEAGCSAVNKIGYVSEDFIAVASFLADNGALALILLFIRVKIPQIAGDVCVIGIFGTCKQRSVV